MQTGSFDPPLPRDLIAGGAVVKATNREVAQAADIIVVMVPDTPDVEIVLFAADGVAAGLRNTG